MQILSCVMLDNEHESETIDLNNLCNDSGWDSVGYSLNLPINKFHDSDNSGNNQDFYSNY